MAQEPGDAVSITERDLYKLLSREDLPTRQDSQIAHGFPYLTGETVINLLNRTLGVGGWSFRPVSENFDKDADEIVVRGEMTADIPTGQFRSDGSPVTRTVVHGQYGGCKIKRSRKDGLPTQLADDHKAAGTECMKKCAQQIGVGLWLSRKEELFNPNDDEVITGKPRPGVRPTRERDVPDAARPSTNGAWATRPAAPTNANGKTFVDDGKHCEICGDELKEVVFPPSDKEPNGSTWDVQKLAGYGRSKYNAIACMNHYKELKRSAENKPNKLPPRDLWVSQNSTQPSTTESSAPTASAGSQTSSARPRPAPAASAQPLPNPPAKTPATELAALKASLTREAAKGNSSPADTEQIEWIEGVLYEAVGPDARPLMDLIFDAAHVLTMADIDAFEKWMKLDRVWAERALRISTLLPAYAEAGG